LEIDAAAPSLLVIHEWLTKPEAKASQKRSAQALTLPLLNLLDTATCPRWWASFGRVISGSV
jgi:hypothetical protein